MDRGRGKEKKGKRAKGRGQILATEKNPWKMETETKAFWFS